MKLSTEEQAFLARRSKLLRVWPYAGALLLILLVGFGVFLFMRVPMLANPFAVLSRLEADSIPESTMAVSAVLLPILLIVCLILASAIVLFSFAHFANERKYLQIIRNVTEASSSQEKAG